jgi:DNA polymerase sigma
MKRKFEKGSNDSLSEDITRKFESLQKEREENDVLKRAWIDELQSIARQKYPKALLVLTGSSANMFGFKASDCDLTLISGERFVYASHALDNIEKLLPNSKYTTTVTSFFYFIHA